MFLNAFVELQDYSVVAKNMVDASKKNSSLLVFITLYTIIHIIPL